MGIEKAEIKIGMAQELGKKYAEMASSLDKDLHRLEGEKLAYEKAAKALASIYTVIDDELDAGRLNLNEPLEIAKMLKRTVTRALGCLENLQDQAKVAEWKTMGRMEGIVKVSEVVRKVADSEQNKITAAITAAIENPDGTTSGRRPAGVRPSPGIAAQRRSEAPPAKIDVEPLIPIPQTGIRTTATGKPRVLKSGGGPKKATKKATKKSP